MDLRRLRYFARIADRGSFTRAAMELGVAQPALSRSIQELEAELAAKLFLRERKGVALTPAGRRLRAHADRIFDQVELAKLDLATASKAVEGIVHVGMPPSVGVSVGPRLIARLSRSHPEVRLRLVEAYSGDIQDMLLGGRVELAILNSRTVGRKEIRTEPLLEDSMYLIKQGRPRSTKKRECISLKSVADRLILPTRAQGLRLLIDEYAAHLGFRLKPAHEVDSVLIVKEMVLRALGHAVLPLPVMRREADAGLVEAFRIEPPLHRSLVLAVAGTRQVSAATRLCMNALHAEVAGP